MSSAEKSQLGADDWILSKFEPSYEGYFVDIGAADGHVISNTLKLDRKVWKGIAIDAFPRNFNGRKNTVVVSAVLSSQKDVEVTFLIPLDYRDFSGIVDYLGTHKDILTNVDNKYVKLRTSVLPDILTEHKSPLTIDFLSIDIEGSEFEVLKTIPFNIYQIKYICVEHNFEEPKRTNIQNLLNKNGFFREHEIQWDDWYTHISVL